MKNASPFICGTVILTISNFLSRLIGFYNRIFLAGMIGAHQIGIYQLIFPVYLLGFAVCFQGFQIALSKITAEKSCRNSWCCQNNSSTYNYFDNGALFYFSFFALYMQIKSVLSFFMNLPACHAFGLLSLFFLLSVSKIVFMDIVLESEILMSPRFLCV